MITTANPNQIAEALTGRNYTSFSAITTYQACPLRYFFRYVEGLPEETVGSSLVFGGAIHSALEAHFRELLTGNSAPDLGVLLAAYQDAWKERDMGSVHFGKDETAESLGRLADRMLRAFQSSDLAAPSGTILGIEEELREALVPGCPDLLARIDLLIDTGTELVVRDFKTARSRWSQDQANESASQLLLYSELVQKLDPTKSVRLEFAVLTKAKQPTVDRLGVPVDRRQVQRIKRTVERVWRAIEERHFYPSPSAMNCPTCPFRAPCRAWPG
ncbi:MAG TPA: PD-(D/E)XK nuclease family protein [Pirellulales bacterium]